MLTLPSTIPAASELVAGASAATSDADVGGYDFMIGGHGFRLATDQNFPYSRATEPTTTHRFDSSVEPGEQSLSPLPWIKSQSSFHGGAGQLNLEQGLTAFEYQQEKVEHIRFETCLGVDPWTLGQVSRLPDCRFYNFGFDCKAVVTATLNGIDYAIIGGTGGLFQAAWLSGPDADPTVTRISLNNSTYVSDANCTITSLATDGANYFGVVQMTAVGYNPNVLTYVFAGQVDSTDTPEAIYRIPNLSAPQRLDNFCTNPSFENNITGWTACYWGSDPPAFQEGTPNIIGGPSVARSTANAYVGGASLSVSVTGNTRFNPATGDYGEGADIHVTGLTSNTDYTVSMYVFVPNTTTFAVGLRASVGITSYGPATTATGVWQRLEMVVNTGAGTSMTIGTGSNHPTGASGGWYVDAVMVTAGSWAYTDYFDGNTAATADYTYAWAGTSGNSASIAFPVTTVGQSPGIVGWQKARLVGLLGPSMYELDPQASIHSDLPVPRYTHPSSLWAWSAIAESPSGILAAGTAGAQSSILEFTLDSTGGTPFLSGGASVAILPGGESVYSMVPVVGSYLALGTQAGIRIGTFDTYTGNLKLGPISVTSTQPVLGVATRDRFVYGGYTNQQPDGKTGLVSIDLSMVVDVAGRNAYAPSLRPPTSAPTGLGDVRGVSVLPLSNRVVFITPEGIHVEGSGPGTDGDAWIRTSRIRYDTAEMKLFKLGRLHGSLDVANIQVIGLAPYGVTQNLGTFGFIAGDDPGEFRLPSGLNEWIQLEFHLQGSAAVLNSYQVKALPAPQRQHIITLTANCFSNESDRFGLDVTDPETPRQRLQNVVDLEAAGDEVRFVEFTNSGSVAQLVVIDQIEFRSYSRPNVEDDFGGYITFRLRTTEN